MAENEETLHSAIDDHADAHLTELKKRVEQARAHVDHAGSVIAAKANPDAAAASAATAPPAPQYRSEAPVDPPAPAAPAPETGTSFADQLAKRVPQTPVVHDASDFGDIAANIATDDDWKNG